MLPHLSYSASNGRDSIAQIEKQLKIFVGLVKNAYTFSKHPKYSHNIKNML